MFTHLHQYFGKFVFVLLNIVMAILLIRFFIIEPGVVDGQSMEETLHDSDRFLVNRMVYMVREPRRYEIVQLYNPQTEDTIVKRIIGLPGETVIIRNGRVIIRSATGEEQLLDEMYIKEGSLVLASTIAPQEMTVPEHSYVVLGDNRAVSTDSRAFGAVHRKYINGKLIVY
jgi:signal peptidase I